MKCLGMGTSVQLRNLVTVKLWLEGYSLFTILSLRQVIFFPPLLFSWSGPFDLINPTNKIIETTSLILLFFLFRSFGIPYLRDLFKKDT